MSRRVDSPFEGPALAITCVRCGAKAGVRCSEPRGYRPEGAPLRYRHAKPHPERVALQRVAAAFLPR